MIRVILCLVGAYRKILIPSGSPLSGESSFAEAGRICHAVLMRHHKRLSDHDIVPNQM